jgi:hypothetical protein
MIYSLKPTESLPALKANYHLVMCESDDINLLATLNKISKDEVMRRLANDNHAYIAFYKSQPAAFGWSASGKAFIGELNHELVLPLGYKYLWNFRTIENFRGLGIYPQLLQHIVRSQRHTTLCFWILHSPENTASRKGILKAGFQFIGEVSVKNLDQVIAGNYTAEYVDDLKALGFMPSVDAPATCWTCSSPYLNHKRTECCCASAQRPCNEKQFRSA